MSQNSSWPPRMWADSFSVSLVSSADGATGVGGAARMKKDGMAAAEDCSRLARGLERTVSHEIGPRAAYDD